METVELIWMGLVLLALGVLVWGMTRSTWDKEQVDELPDGDHPIDFIGRHLS